ncbi:ABC-F family ATP-binding cassette domain-containing protein [Anaerotignum lactatifermentans]|uniref:ABC-F family ATP-binding cassette domain-containing protein n=1 Tax=Anaerotignum lactatifermentans TaxID=160404 RepID=A0ABS2G7T6_9FIRM|nr:ABC-F family ATP-binding cassette domain-containing protein [Anaerotignum lactatifermentans]MBM6829127.1 ABC-F family ATP-binding cassette domain-containing protein [Anaerotignum lactatifermentans]MBM6877265.1 ABC-F family ATP-binding cassette domain-containing protein [Anaerotignum lactatifermentans]MBM6950638.1 ABC-F family ATP-binding cassette domain-containing protein [Anaerotignum lactatifermentans]
MILSLKQIQKSYGIDTILENISFHIEEREKAAIVGVNGAGKTTLFRILTGETSADGGQVYLKKETSVGYMAQNQQIEGNRTIYEEMLSVFEDILTAESQLREMENEMGRLSGQALSDKMEEYAALQHFFEQNDGYGYKSHMKGVLKGLGFSEEEFDKPLSQLSGGQKTRVYLGRLLLSRPDLLLLDEPTNHLDIASIQWLEDFLKTYAGSVLIISHDRYFLDRIVTKVIEIENRKSTVYNGNYTNYMSQKAVNREVQQKAYDMQQREIRRQEEVIRTLKAFNREKSIKRAESREKALEKMERIDRPDALPDQMRLTLTPQITSGSNVLHAEALSKSYGGQTIFRHVNFDVKRGEKVAIIGPNGVGKSTLFKMVLGEVSNDTGMIRFGTNVHVGYYDQEQQKLDERKTIFDEISDTYPNLTAGQIRNVLAAFVFTGDDVFKPISALSGGEKGRVSLAKIMLSKANLLMLDEPTNHLDMFSKEILEDALNRYEGTVVYISHDRYFINKTAEKILELSPDGVTQYAGNYDYYLEKKAEQERKALEQAKDNPVPTAPQTISDTKSDWLKQKEQQAAERKLAAKIARVEKAIEEAEAAMAKADEDMAAVGTDYAKAQEIYEEKQKIEAQLETLYEEWESLQ